MSLYTDEHGYEKITPVSGAMTEVVARIEELTKELPNNES